ncbi:class I SAM-dependent methyltransferase [Polyangium jinanense]|uniref:Methyltransferase domain-containing protein n=1 Tax=Polyangium jinanense TaxID=2829994 RepID=A0A9X3XIC4_9BACT|nr:methyltransferase domain-containing protein [Polyangium jinanense]MDC3962455.1 methyltransferase domain-containing protein [Polyangium jinanense]MDC3988621.1 methyltransferase domain-containing protein [Polyangium jinanense]
MHTEQPYIHALGHGALTRFYDPFIRAVTRERAFKERLIDLSDVRPGHRVLDVGAGTGTLVLLLKQRIPQAVVVGLDGDPKILAMARQKAAAAGVDVELREGFAQRLPFPDASFDRVVTSLVLHHLSLADKTAAFREMARVLAPGGELHVADLGPPRSLAGQLAAGALRRVGHLRDNLDGRLPELMRAAGFTRVEETSRLYTLFGPLAYLRGETSID